MYDIKTFSLKEMVECSGALRTMGSAAASMEEAAGRIVHYLHDNFTDQITGEKSFALIRLFKTHPYGQLDDDLSLFARNILADDPSQASPDMKCLTLLASAGVKPEWQERKNSLGHKAIPLPSGRFIERFPMVRQLVQQLGLEVNTVLRPDPKVVMDLAQKNYNVFHIPEAVGSRYVPAQDEFVIPFGVRSVLGFGGVLPSGNLFAVIMFARVNIPRDTADLFKTLALSIKVAVLPFDGGRIFA